MQRNSQDMSMIAQKDLVAMRKTINHAKRGENRDQFKRDLDHELRRREVDGIPERSNLGVDVDVMRES